MVKVHHSQELLQGPHCDGPWEVRDRVNLRWEWHGPALGDSMSQEVDGGQPKLALSWVDNKSVPAETLEEDPQVGQVFGFGGTGHEDVVQVHKQEGQIT